LEDFTAWTPALSATNQLNVRKEQISLKVCMLEKLPKLTVKPDISPRDFIRKISELVPEQDIWKIGSCETQKTGEIYLLLELAGRTSRMDVPSDVMAHFGHYSKVDNERVWIQMMARDWPGGNPSYDSYVSAANLIKPLLSLYNRRYKAKVRLSIQSRQSLIPKLSPMPAMYFSHFVRQANKGALHPLDWQLFYSFIAVSHRLRSKLTASDIKYLLVREGFDEDYAREIASVYSHGRGLLRNGCPPTSWSLIELIKKWAEERN
jgi:hypothetical protein